MPITLIYTPDYSSPFIPSSVKEHKPVIFKEHENTYCCLLGEDPQAGIFGCGNSFGEAMEDWDSAYQQFLQQDPELLSSITSKTYSYERLGHFKQIA